MIFEPHAGYGGNDPDGDPWPFGYISEEWPVPLPIFELNPLFAAHPAELVELALKMAAADKLYDALVQLVADFADYPASERPCLAFDMARAAIARATPTAEGVA